MVLCGQMVEKAQERDGESVGQGRVRCRGRCIGAEKEEIVSWWSWLDLLQDVRDSHQAGGLALFGLEDGCKPTIFQA